MIEIQYSRNGVEKDIRYFKTVNEYVDWIRAERILYPEVREEFSKGSSFCFTRNIQLIL